MLQKDPPRYIHSASSSPPLPPHPVNAVVSIVHWLLLEAAQQWGLCAFCLFLILSPPPPLRCLSLTLPLLPLAPSLSFSLYLNPFIKFPVTQQCRGYSSLFLLSPSSLIPHHSCWNLSPHPVSAPYSSSSPSAHLPFFGPSNPHTI